MTWTVANLTAMAAGLALAGLSAVPTVAAELKATVLGSYETGVFDDGAAEIVAHDAKNQRLYVTNGHDKAIDVLDFANPKKIVKLKSISVKPYGKNINSLAIHGDRLAAAIEASPKQAAGKVVLFDLEGKEIAQATVGALPDMVTFTPDGEMLLVANEGEPSKDYKNDPEGSVSIVNLADMQVRTVSFAGLDKAKLGPSAHFPSPKGTSVAQDVEPEYIAVSADSKTAFVVLQENNAMAVIDIKNGAIKNAFGLGFKDFSKHAIDVTDKDKKTVIKTWPVKGMYQPDAIAAFSHQGATYIVTANEGDAREYDGYSEETRVGKLKLDPKAFPNAARLQKRKMLGRLKTTTARGDLDGDGDHDEIYAYGGRSFSIYKEDGTQVFDSGNDFTMILSKRFPTWFNSEGQENNFDKRSDDKGVEPEGVVIGMVKGKRYAFIGLERMGGVMIYNIDDPAAAKFVDYIHNVKPGGDAEKGTGGDTAPEGLAFIKPEQSPTGKAILVVANEVSGTTTAFELE